MLWGMLESIWARRAVRKASFSWAIVMGLQLLRTRGKIQWKPSIQGQSLLLVAALEIWSDNMKRRIMGAKPKRRRRRTLCDFLARTRISAITVGFLGGDGEREREKDREEEVKRGKVSMRLKNVSPLLQILLILTTQVVNWHPWDSVYCIWTR